MEDIEQLAKLITRRNALEDEITRLISRPAAIGHIGEYLAARIFNIELEHSASAKSIDGHFTSGPLAGRSVNVKWYAKSEGLLDLSTDEPPDYYLVLAGPRSSSASSRDGTRPWLIDSVHLFASGGLTEQLLERRVKLGTACSVPRRLWEASEIYPNTTNAAVALTADQRRLLGLFGSALHG